MAFNMNALRAKTKQRNAEKKPKFVPAELNEGNVQAIEKYQKNAEAGDAEAQYQLGLHYLDKLDSSTADKWFEKAAAQGHKGANFMCGIRCGISGARKQKDSLTYFKNAALAGHELSKKLVGLMQKKTFFKTEIIPFETAFIELLHQDVELTGDEMSAFLDNYYSGFSSTLRQEYDAYRSRLMRGEKYSK